MTAITGLANAPGRQGWRLAWLQALQLGTGLLGQFWLLTRWAPLPETDPFVLLSGIPWIAGAALLVSGVELCLPAALHRAATEGNEAPPGELLAQVTGLTLLASVVAGLVSAGGIALWAARLGLGRGYSLLMGAALGGQLLPFGLATLGRGLLIARDRVARARWTLLAGSIATALGYGVAPLYPGVALPAVTLGAMMVTALAAWAFCRAEPEPLPGLRASLAAAFRPWHAGIPRLLSSLVALGVAAALVHAETLVMRTAVAGLGTGSITALSVAQRGWEALLALVVAASVWPAYSRWASGEAASPPLFRWVLGRTWGLTLAAATLVAAGLVVLGSVRAQLPWQSTLEQGIGMTWVLLPRFVLLSAIQPLVLRHFAAGSPWHPVLASAAGLGVLAAAAPLGAARGGSEGLALAFALAVLPGWAYLGWRALREVRACAS